MINNKYDPDSENTKHVRHSLSSDLPYTLVKKHAYEHYTLLMLVDPTKSYTEPLSVTNNETR